METNRKLTSENIDFWARCGLVHVGIHGEGATEKLEAELQKLELSLDDRVILALHYKKLGESLRGDNINRIENA
ncbi:MAG: hypothetical protein Q7R44_00285 [bacterium]|nr:hypothetical protein [bacterium]